MSELARVAKTLAAGAERGLSSTLATVVRTEGSTYRRLGARLVIVADGTRSGAVSAGCLEHDIILRADGLRASGAAHVVRYDTRSPDDLVWGFGIGCGGLVEVLVEPLTSEQAASKASEFARIADVRQSVVLATVIRGSEASGLHAGAQGVLRDVRARLTGLDGPWLARIQVAARQALRRRRSVAVSHRWSGATIDIAYEVVTPRIGLAVCGGGSDAVPVVAAAKRLDWHVTLIDDRPERAVVHRWPDVDRILVSSPNCPAVPIAAADSEAAVIMTHNFERDVDLLEGWLQSRARYIGIMGPRHRTQALVTAVQARGVTVDQNARQRIHGPVGIDIGAETPEEIAVAIVAEVQAVHATRAAGFLTYRQGAIHEQ
jgi:xanthine dehydrogenase accessory factor